MAFQKPLYSFQRIGGETLARNPHFLLADQPGTGKTAQAIYAADLANAKNVLVVCPASVRSGWAQELEECLGRVPRGWEIVSYNYASELSRSPSREKYDALICDEAHFLRSLDSQRSIAVLGNQGRGLAHRAHYKWMLSGTPVLNRPRELFPVLKTLCPAFAEYSFARFAQEFCGAYWTGREINTRGASNVDRLACLLDSFMLRRTKREVFPDRKEPVITMPPLDVTSEDLKAVWDEEQVILDRESYLSPTSERFAQLGDLARLLRLTGEAKVRANCDFVEDLLATVDKVVVFFQHTEVGRRMAARFAERGFGPVVHQGGMSDKQKDEEKEKFTAQSGVRIFLGQIQSAGTGLDGLQEVCSDVVVAEQSWVPGELGQAIDRLDRLRKDGTWLDCVNAYVTHAPGTLESAVLRAREGKEKVVRRLMGDDRGVADPVAGFSADLLEGLL